VNRWAVAAALTIVAWCAIELLVRRPDTITDDWQGWRQADTQAIARNLAHEEFDPLRPRIDWRGDGPGYVETELQLYPALIALVMKATGESELPGQLLSLIFVALAAALLHRALARRFGDRAAYVALLAVLSMQGTVVMGTSIQPDSLAFLLYVVGFVAFLDRRHALWIAATLLAALVKPTTLELGITQFVFVLLTDRRALRRPVLWIGWGLVLAGVALFLLHARSLYVEYGNTFGVLSGGDSKLPALSRLTAPQTWIDLARFTIVWGIGIPAVPALAFLLWRRGVGAEELALAAGATVLLLVALRYTSGPFGTHYHLPHIVLGAWLVARAVAELERATPTRGLLIAAAFAALLLEARALRYVRAQPPQPETSVGRMLAAHAAPGTLVVVRARAPRIDPDWHTVNNCEDPRVFYLSRTKGWVLANDEPGAAPVADLAARGARFYAHVNQMPPDADLAAWLASHADVVATGPAGTVYALR
jgi:4-amino-4-deoxy-L-arabinose transferase-like glycosyltransferase